VRPKCVRLASMEKFWCGKRTSEGRVTRLPQRSRGTIERKRRHHRPRSMDEGYIPHSKEGKSVHHKEGEYSLKKGPNSELGLLVLLPKAFQKKKTVVGGKREGGSKKFRRKSRLWVPVCFRKPLSNPGGEKQPMPWGASTGHWEAPGPAEKIDAGGGMECENEGLSYLP